MTIAIVRANASEARWQIASALPLDSRTPNRFPGELRDPTARDSMPRGQRHDRCLQPRPERGGPNWSGSRALVRARHLPQRS